MARCTASVAPPMTHSFVLFTLATTTYPSTSSTVRATSATGPKTAAMRPLSPSARRVMASPRAATAVRASPKGMPPAATRAPYSPREWPITISGSTPYDAKRRDRAVSTVSTAGWVTAVCFSPSSAAATASGSSLSTKILADRGIPRRGAMTRSASWNVSSTTGSAARSSFSMPTYWDPCPVKRKATFPASPRPRYTPLLRRARQRPSSPDSSAVAAFSASSANSPASP